MDRETRAGTVEIRSDSGDNKITGYAAVFDRLSEDLGGFREKISYGAFDSVIEKGADVRALINHEPDKILGRTTSSTLDLRIHKRGLYFSIHPPDTQYARDLIKSIERGDITSSSFAFQVEKDDWVENDDGTIIRTITEISKLYDISPVTYPAYPDTKVAVRFLNSNQIRERNNKSIEIRRLIMRF